MRKVTFGVANSLDNYIARKDDAVDWLLWSDDTRVIMAEFWKKIDSVIMGRKTYEVALRNVQASESGLHSGMTTYVISRTMPPEVVEGRGAKLVSGDAVEFLGALKSAPGKEIVVMGGGELARPLIEAGLIDEIGVNIHPVLLGSGIPLFHEMTRQVDLELLECRALAKGCVYLLYRVEK